MFEKRDPKKWRVQVQCEMEDCVACEKGHCQADYISIDTWKECENYEVGGEEE